MLEDLRIAKHHLVACFPPKYNIFQYTVSLYHTEVADRLHTIIAEGRCLSNTINPCIIPRLQIVFIQ